MEKPLAEGVDYELDAEGRWVFTAAYLRGRGYCCGRGCRHCPYDHENVPDKESESRPPSGGAAGPQG